MAMVTVTVTVMMPLPVVVMNLAIAEWRTWMETVVATDAVVVVVMVVVVVVMLVVPVSRRLRPRPCAVGAWRRHCQLLLVMEECSTGRRPASLSSGVITTNQLWWWEV